MALKLAKNGMVSRASQIAQRRAGLRKQRALQEKAFILKMTKGNKKKKVPILFKIDEFIFF